MCKLFKLLTVSLCIALVFIIDCKKKTTEPENRLQIILVNEEKEAGRCVVLWEQLDDEGDQVTDGRYRAQIVADGFQGVDEFQILTGNAQAPAACDSTYCEADGGQLPQSFSISVDRYIYAPHDTVCIYFDLPAASSVQIKIEKIR
ncbi:MAG: hypothetical protein OEV55_03485 [candidate division Zixibacteria bacterium]|nr:hypothetical protein [candidate division Zixibacteria bacterium]